MDCELTYYKTDDGKGGSPSCQTCPVGGTCKDNAFTAKLTGSIWTKVSEKIDGKTTLVMRVDACPVGFSLVRSRFNPAGDQCEECPPETYNIQGMVLAKNGWFAFQERIKCRRSGSRRICPGA
jgi:hypothetical protein